MCSRYTLRKKPFKVEVSDDRSLTIEASVAVDTHTARYNIAPTQDSIVLTKSENCDTLEAHSMRWGLVPNWSKSVQTRSPLVNAQSETITEKPSFKAAFQRRRCLVPADGFYEWKKKRSFSVPHFFHLKDDSVFYMAGIWEIWQDKLGEKLGSYTILTTRPNSLVTKYHDRMPVILHGEAIEKWLNYSAAQLDTNARLEFFTPIDASLMTCHPANPLVNNNTSEGPDCLVAPKEQAASQLDFGIE